MKLTIPITAALISALSMSSAFAAGSGSGPKGKPFVAINDQIVVVEGAITSLQDQIDDLVGRVDSIEADVAAHETAITTLQTQNTTLGSLIAQNATDIASIEAAIAQLQSDNASLLAMIGTNSGDIATLQGEVDTNSALIVTLQSALLAVQNGMIDLEDNLQVQINNNLSLIGAIESEMDALEVAIGMKQNVINGNCPSGEAIREVLSDGAVVCENTNGGTTGQLQMTTVYHSQVMSKGHHKNFWVNCPSGWVLTGSGHYGYRMQFYGSRILPGYNAAVVDVDNTSPYVNTAYGIANCARIIP